ncbi:MAG: hypothetical protein UX77_C0005G0005 [Parcubacteria group bacterium GW2011_GWA1_47_11]|uniref:Uncharacterized protein n=1 Tax=Candidatus Colwellbacteria bacterium GWA2_46_10 TaxID=1797684 RepID=A0A1G1YUT2_9BACT|nr:MAG: hypothetical protein UX29_C0009G0028 [Parcubacteria group bacterium GW2011_GWA2_46_10]KKU55976.1 MAG: hypothetical protein UX77_C0005G0005 [Parcubacteria group bacterium GW2011_GWA1_47_11]OGY56131.1 MAG: hypothetical protein A2119_02910 [Candidatus Colwellbacteria bacterium GWA2_46_10]
MKLSTSITVVVLTLGVAFFAYLNRDQIPPEPLQANIVESLPDKPEIQKSSPSVEPAPQVKIIFTEGLNEEWNSIAEGNAKNNSDFDHLGPEKTATGAGN